MLGFKSFKAVKNVIGGIKLMHIIYIKRWCWKAAKHVIFRSILCAGRINPSKVSTKFSFCINSALESWSDKINWCHKFSLIAGWNSTKTSKLHRKSLSSYNNSKTTGVSWISCHFPHPQKLPRSLWQAYCALAVVSQIRPLLLLVLAPLSPPPPPPPPLV